MSDYNVEIIRLRVATPEIREELLSLRPKVLAEYADRAPGGFTAELRELEDGTWMDLWTWESRELAEKVLAEESSPSFARWVDLVELVSLEWAREL